MWFQKVAPHILAAHLAHKTYAPRNHQDGSVSCVSIRGRADSTAEALTAAQLAATAEVTMQPHWRLAGSAVTPPAARDLIDVVVEALTGEPVRLAA